MTNNDLDAAIGFVRGAIYGLAIYVVVWAIYTAVQ